MDIVIERSQNILQKRAVLPISFIMLAEGQTCIRAVNSAYPSCVLPAGLIMALFCESPGFAEMFPVSKISKGAVSPASELKTWRRCSMHGLQQSNSWSSLILSGPIPSCLTPSNMLPVEDHMLNILSTMRVALLLIKALVVSPGMKEALFRNKWGTCFKTM